jgi:uncharacterized protein YegP (UPF0339 family)
MDKVEYYKDSSGDWRWRRQSENGKIVAVSGEGYENFDDCEKQATGINGMNVEYIDPRPESSE